jgi:hypothetical protein
MQSNQSIMESDTNCPWTIVEMSEWLKASHEPGGGRELGVKNQ